MHFEYGERADPNAKQVSCARIGECDKVEHQTEIPFRFVLQLTEEAKEADTGTGGYGRAELKEVYATEVVYMLIIS